MWHQNFNTDLPFETLNCRDICALVYFFKHFGSDHTKFPKYLKT